MHELATIVSSIQMLAADIGPYWRFSGVFHPASTHLPIGLLTVAGLIELYHLARRRKSPNTTAVICLCIGTVGAIGATVLGWALASTDGGIAADSDEQAVHRWTGLALAVISPVVAFAALAAYRNADRRRMLIGYRVGALALVGLVSLTGSYGGKLTHGTTYYSRAYNKLLTETRSGGVDDRKTILTSTGGAPKSAASIAATRPATSAAPTSAVAVAAVSAGSASVTFEQHVKAIFDAKCISCHGPAKQKGKYRCDTLELTMKPGAVEEVIAIPGNAKDSPLYQMVLGIGDYEEEKMPPDGKDELTPAEVEIVKAWIDQGAK